MTVLIGKLSDVAYARGARSFTITCFQEVRSNDAGDGIVVNWPHVQKVDSDTSFTTPELDPGPAYVQFTPNGKKYYITIPDSGSPVQIGPLIEAGLPAPPNTLFGQFIANGGNLHRGDAMSDAEYSALIASQTPDPGSFFMTF